MGRWCVGVALLAACGRVGFDARDDGALVPGRAPAVELDLLSGSTAGLSFLRGSPASYIGADRLIHDAAIDEPRFEHDPFTGAPRGLLIENTNINFVVYSEQLNNGIEWFSDGAILVIADAAVAPDGSLTADELVDNDTAIIARRAQASAAVANEALSTFSIFLKAGTQTRATFGAELLGGSPEIQLGMDIDLSTGTITMPPAGGESHGILPFANGWYRVWITLQNNNTNTQAVISVWGNLASVSETGSVYAWGAQIENGPVLTSYIETPTNQGVLRSGDYAALGDLSGITPEQGSLLVTASLIQSFVSMTAGYQPLACMITSPEPMKTCISRKTSTDRTHLALDNTDIATGGDWAGTKRRTIIAAWDEASATLHEPLQSNTLGLGTPLPAFDSVILGFDQSVALDGCIERLAYWPFALTAAELTAAGVQ